MNKFESCPGEMENLIRASEIGMKAFLRNKRRMADHILAIESELADLEKSCEAYREILVRIATKARWLAENDERLKADCHLVHIAMVAEDGLK